MSSPFQPIDRLIENIQHLIKTLRPSPSHQSTSRSGMLKVGEAFPTFSLDAVVSLDPNNAFKKIGSDNYLGKWLVVFFWPKDFTFVCPTEIVAFGKLYQSFQERDAELLGVSTDSEYVHLNWRKQHKDLKDLPFPMLADIKKELSTQCGILDAEKGIAQRATFIIDPEGITRFVMVTDLSVGRNPNEVLRILDALQTDELCPCNWKKGEETLS
jgi:lipoyl-dependent peroxiredoxin subunit C